MNQIEPNVFDRLLYYLSHMGELDWERFKDAVKNLTREEPSLKYSTYLTSLARLGHLDYNPMNLDRVVGAPSVLVEAAVENRYILVGSRSPDFLKEIKKYVSKTDGKLHLIPGQYAPMTIMLTELTEAAFAEIENLGVHVSRAFSAKLSSLLPIPKRTNFQQIEISFSEAPNKFNINTLKYERDNHFIGDDGLCEIPQYGPDVYVLKSGSDQRKVPRDWGEWLLLSAFGRTGLISYEKKSQTWCVNQNLLVPLIVDRCATLCSGFPPTWKGDLIYYSNVPVGIAYRLTKLLYQDWEVV